MAKKYDIIKWSTPWQEAFSSPENCGVWFIWGQSGNGKTSFCMQLLKELAHLGPCFYNSLEEGVRLTIQAQIDRFALTEVAHNILFGCEDMDELNLRLLKKRSPKYIFIDSVQHTTLNRKELLKLRSEHPEKLFIIISQAEGKLPEGRPAKSIRFDADLKLHVEGYRATSLGRYNPGGYYTIWAERAEQYWGIK